jgi:hypothetical protein
VVRRDEVVESRQQGAKAAYLAASTARGQSMGDTMGRILGVLFRAVPWIRPWHRRSSGEEAIGREDRAQGLVKDGRGVH